MAGIKIDPAAVSKARDVGYSDDEIVSFLSQKNPGQFKQAADAGYSSKEILDHLAPPQQGAMEGIGGALRQGAADVGAGIGETLKQTGLAPSVGEAMKRGAAQIAPSQTPDTALLKDGSVQASNIPRAIAEQTPGLAATLAAAKAAAKIAPGGLKGKALAGLVAGATTAAGMTFGNRAKENAAERTGDANAEPETGDKVRAGITEAAICSAEHAERETLPSWRRQGCHHGPQGHRRRP
jgi:hypothetical protein